MYLYVVLFNEHYVKRESYSIKGDVFEQVKEMFPRYIEMPNTDIQACIAIIKGKDNRQKSSLSISINNIELGESYLKFDFLVDKKLDITNESLDKSLYRYAKDKDLVNVETNYYPSIWILDKNEFDQIRKGNYSKRKMISQNEKIEELKSENKWLDICNLYEPLEGLSQRTEIWNNADELYQVGFACSKMGEPQNGKERDKAHLEFIKRYRELSLIIYERCCELELKQYRYPSAMAYRHYQNVNELTKQKGRRDDNVSAEFESCLEWLDRALSLHPSSIKDNYRKGKLILDKWIDNYRYSQQRKWDKEDYEKMESMEKEALKSLHTVLGTYEAYGVDDEKRRFFRKEYAKSLYLLGSHHISKYKLPIDEWVVSKITKQDFDFSISKEMMNHIRDAKIYYEKCYELQAGGNVTDKWNPKDLITDTRGWVHEPMDLFYRIGSVYLHMYFVKYQLDKESPKVEEYGQKSKAYLSLAKEACRELRNRNIEKRQSDYIDNLLAQYFMLQDRNDEAIKLLRNHRKSFIKNTYASALMLSEEPENQSVVESTLLTATEDKYNLANDISKALLAIYYHIVNDVEKAHAFCQQHVPVMKNNGKRLLEIAGIGDEYAS